MGLPMRKFATKRGNNHASLLKTARPCDSERERRNSSNRECTQRQYDRPGQRDVDQQINDRRVQG